MPPDAPPPKLKNRGPSDWAPYRDRLEFETADLLYRRVSMSVTNLDNLFELWAVRLLKHKEIPPFANALDLYNTIDSTPLGDVPWQCITLRYNDDVSTDSDGRIPSWMTAEYEAWFRNPHVVVQNMVANPDYKDAFDVAPVQMFTRDGDRRYEDFMSGDWAWNEAVSSSCVKQSSRLSNSL